MDILFEQQIAIVRKTVSVQNKMNERIKQFVMQSHLDVYGLGSNEEKWNAVVTRFSELLINDCVEHAAMFVSRNDHPRPSQISYYITSKMGVGEEKWEKFTKWPEL